MRCWGQAGSASPTGRMMHNLDKFVAIKEYLPSGVRHPGTER